MANEAGTGGGEKAVVWPWVTLSGLLVAALVFPFLAGPAAGGFLLGLVVKTYRTNKRFRAVANSFFAAVGLLVVVIAALIALLWFLGACYQFGPKTEVTATVSVAIDAASGDSIVALTELEMPSAEDFAEAVGTVFAEERLDLQMAEELARFEWVQGGSRDGHLLLQHRLVLPRPGKVLPARTVLTVPVPTTSAHLRDQVVTLIPRRAGSEAVVVAGEYAVLRTWPAGVRSPTLRGGELEMRLPLGELGSSYGVRLEYVSPIFRNRVGHALLAGALWWPLKWLVFGIFAVFGHRIREAVVVPVANSLARKVLPRRKRTAAGYRTEESEGV